MSSRIHAALEAIGLRSTYEDKFDDELVNDAQVALCIKNPSYKMIHQVIESPDDYELFVDAFSHPEKYSTGQEPPEDHTDENSNHFPVKGFTLESNSKGPRSLWNSVNISHLSRVKNQEKQNGTSHAVGQFVTMSPASGGRTNKTNVHSIKAFTQFLTTLKRHRFSKSKDSQDLETHGKHSIFKHTHTHTTGTRASVLFPEPVQIIDIPIKTPGQTKTPASALSPSLIFHSEQLESILSKVGRRPVALLSIAGPSRQGKSFLLSYMVKYLQFLSSSNQDVNTDLTITASDSISDWMGKHGFKKKQPLLGGFIWRSGVERETTGIWMWPEPFTLKSKDGTEFDVLLMDTQGVFDDYTDKKDWATIVGLSLLTSSCLIFNIMNNLQEDSLNTLKDFMDFGLMAKNPNPVEGENKDDKPFQKLLFLIRDWNAPDDYDFGAEGGASFLKANLQRRNTESGAQIRSQIQQCFEQLDCFLMPEPGSRVKRSNYDGSVAGMDPEFADNIQRCIEHIFNPSTFAPKIISGNLVTGDDLFLFFEQYIKIFNSDQMPSPHDMNLANALICNQTIINKCLSLYEESMQELQDQIQRSFLLETELYDINEASTDKALELFQSSRKMGSPEEVAKCKESLLSRISDFSRLVSAENSIIQKNAVQEATHKLESYFINQMELKIQEAFEGPDDFIMDDEFNSIYEKCKTRSEQFLEERLDLESLDLLPVAQQNFHNILLSLKEPMQLQNRIKKSDAEAKQREEISKQCLQYKSEMERVIKKYKYWTEEQLQKEEKNYSETVTSNFSSMYKNSSLYSQGIDLISQNLQKELANIDKIVQMQNENYMMSLNYLVSELINSYTSKMEESAQTKGELGSTHKEEKEVSLTSLKNTQDFDRLLPSTAEEFISNLSSQIDKICQQLVDKWFPRIRQRSIKNYKETINKFYGTNDRILEESELNAEHDLVKNAALQDFKTFTSNIPVPIFRNSIDDTENTDPMSAAYLLEDFEAEVDNHMAIIQEKNKLRAEAVKSTLGGFLSKAKTMYLELAKEINEVCYSKENFEEQSNEAKDKTLRYFQDQCKTNEDLGDEEGALSSSDIEASLLKLEEFIDQVAVFKMVDPSTLEISAPVIKFSTELTTLENIYTRNPSCSLAIKEVRWIASSEIYIDEDLCGEFWSGKNLVLYTKAVFVKGNDRLIVVSGENGKSASSTPPPTPEENGECGINGIDGEAGESGGNIVILADEIHKAKNLRIISNGGQGGNGQPGGNGSSGIDGVNGDHRYTTSITELEQRFPSPAKLVDSHSNYKKGRQYLREIAEANETQVVELECINSGSHCLTVETQEGAKFRYGFFEGGLKGLIKGRSFYIWFQGAPGTLGQSGGYGGLGGRGGNPGNPGKVDISPECEGDKMKIVRKPGTPGYEGREGRAGITGKNGMQGTDHAIVDPYAGLYVPSNFLSKKKFSGRLGIYFVKFSQRNEAAYCPHEKKYLTFIDIFDVREGIKVYQEPKDERQKRKPMKSARNKTQIAKESLKLTYSINKFKPTPTVGRAGGYYVEESELRSCINNEFLSTSVIDTYATILRELYPNDQVAYLPCTAFCFSGNQWSMAQYLDEMMQTLMGNITPALTFVASIVSVGRHWILLVANLKTGKIFVADTLDGYCSDKKLNDGISIFTSILDKIEVVDKWKTKYFTGIAKQNDSHSCGPAALYFLDQLYRNQDIKCNNHGYYLNYRKSIVKKILMTTDEGKKILDGKNDYTTYLGMQILE